MNPKEHTRKIRFKPSYLKLYESGELAERIKELDKILLSCKLCPRKCGVNRTRGEIGVCKSGKELMVSSYNPHYGEEIELVGNRTLAMFGRGGSGTIFLTNCSLLCVFCQNYDVSHLGHGRKRSKAEVAGYMIKLQNVNGCHNINFVTPTHFAPQLVEATEFAIKKGLRIPIVWNCGGYENVEVIKLLKGIVDIYMPDIKYGRNESSKRYSKVPALEYFERCKESIKEMHRQVGDLKLDERGIANRGLLIRHLVMPGNVAGSEKVLNFIAKEISKESFVNIMSQYRPAGEAHKYPELNRIPSQNDFGRVVKLAEDLDLIRGL